MRALCLSCLEVMGLVATQHGLVLGLADVQQRSRADELYAVIIKAQPDALLAAVDQLRYVGRKQARAAVSCRTGVPTLISTTGAPSVCDDEGRVGLR